MNEKTLLEVEDYLRGLDAGSVKRNEELKNHTTWKIGGPAQILFEPESAERLSEALKYLNRQSIPWYVLGRGSNILVGDNGIRGVVIKLGENMAFLEKEGTVITAGAGYSLIKLATVLSKEGYSGLEFAGGIPGTVGGAVFMNAGAHNREIASVLSEALILSPDGSTEWRSNEKLSFSYRKSVLQEDGGVCLAARFKMEKGDETVIREKLQQNKQYRKETQPWKDPCCGSVFRNPLPHSAGALIEEAGLKGCRIGGAQVSEKHANFIVNADNATARDVIQLIEYVQKTVFELKGIRLTREVEITGESMTRF